MESDKDSGAGDKAAAANPNPNPNPNPDSSPPAESAPVADAAPQRRSRAPFTSLSQFDSDLALARALQEQERAYMMLRMNGDGGGGGGDAGFDQDGSEYEEEDGMEGDDDGEDDLAGDEEEGEGSDYGEDAFDAMDRALDPSEFENDEAYAAALQEAEARELVAQMMALTGLEVRGEDDGDHGDNSQQDEWEDVDPDEMSYEELVALGEVVGTESRGLSANTIASLPSIKYKAESVEDGNTDQCVICRLDYEDGDSLVVLSCKHTYHPECIKKWLQINKVCPMCSAEVSTSQ